VILAALWLVAPTGAPASRSSAITALHNRHPVTTTSLDPTTTTTTGPGSLPQSGAFPTASDAKFTSSMTSLFGSISSGTPATASAAFFPEAAYLQLKVLPNSSSDYEQRLVAEYDLDIQAAHRLLASQGPTARLVGVSVPEANAHWVQPGVCSNSIGYFEVANSRIIYTVGGQRHSIGIASLISWRGQWYVVHLGAILRSGSGGVVLDPESGDGSSPPSTTC